MQVFKLFFKIAKTKKVMIIIFVVIFLLMIRFNDNHSSTDEMFTTSRMKLTVYDKDGTEASKKLCEHLAKGNDIYECEDDKDKLTDALYYTATNYVITINEGYEKNLEEGNTDGLFSVRFLHDSYTNRLADDELNTYVKVVRAYMAGGSSLYEAIDQAEESLAVKSDVKIKTVSEEDVASRSELFFYYLPYVIISLVVTILSPVLISMNRKELSRRTRCSSMKESAVNVQTILASITLVALIMVGLLGYGVVENGGMYSGRIWFCVLNTVIFTVVCTALALLLSTFNISENALTFMIQVLGLGMSFLCGVFVPMEYMGNTVKLIGRFLPAYWYIQVCEMVFGKTVYDAHKAFAYMGVELLFAVAFISVMIAIKRQKRTEEA
ncbi:MAG: ABC transporter permease [Lachnospiraceae bacterium]|nr:ABC transporter permease [Lachnospiraceae bacterium]